MESIRRFFQPPRGSFFLFGPRGTGKSTWTREWAPSALYVDLLDPENFRSLLARPELLRDLISGGPGVKDVVIDEVQKAPELLEVVHSLMEQKKGLRFILTGSSSRKLRRAGTDLLGGRALLCSMHPFVAAELKDRFDVGKALRLGMLPVVLDSQNPEATLRSYAALYVKEEVQAEGLLRNVGQFSRFLEAIAFSHASVLNISNVARECQAERKTIEGYLAVLEDLLLGYRLPVFVRKAKRDTASHPKFYYFDAGVYRSLRACGPLDRTEEIDGAALEGLICQHLVAWNAYSGAGHSLHYWRTRSGVEVDFVLYGPSRFCAMEVKNASRVRPEDLRSLKAFREDYPEAALYLLYRGPHRLVTDGIHCIPCRDFLRQLEPGRWPD